MSPRIVDAPEFPSAHRWPVTLRYHQLILSPFHPRDLSEVVEVRNRNTSWLGPWDPTSPTLPEQTVTAAARVRASWRQARRGMGLPWLVRWVEAGRQPVIGQCTVSNIVHGSVQSATIGYWIDQAYAGRSITVAAVALAADYAWTTLGLHRIEICVRPENRASLRVVEKLGFRHEGHRARYIHIAGDWRDHEAFVLTAEEVPQGLLSRVPKQVVGHSIHTDHP